MNGYARAAFAITLFAGSQPCAAQKAAASAATPAAAPLTTPATYVGSATCGMCHEDIGKAFASSPHEAVDKGDKHGFAGNACEALTWVQRAASRILLG